MWRRFGKVKWPARRMSEIDVRVLNERQALKYLMKKYGTNRGYTSHYLNHMLNSHKNNPRFGLYMESELGSLNRSRFFIKSLSEVFRNRNLFLEKKCLDIGSSAGNSLIAFIEYGASRAVGIEVCEGRFQTAKINIDGCSEDSKRKIKIYREDIQNVEVLKLGQFDTIFCNDVLEHVKDPVLAVKHICKLLSNKRDAFAYVNLRNYQNPENIVHEPHYDMPGMVLLPYEVAKEYYASCSRDNVLQYEVYHWKSFFDYKKMFQSFGKKCEFYGGVNPKLSDIQHMEEKAGKLLDEFKAFSDGKGLEPRLRRTIEEHINDYMVKMGKAAEECRMAHDERLMMEFYLNYVVFDIKMLVRNKE